MTLAKRTFTSASWKFGTNTIIVIIVFARVIILARLLPVDVFGIFAFASSVTRLSVIFTDFGISGAFIHRAPETEDINRAAAVQFTLRTLLTVLWAALLMGGTLIFTEPSSMYRTAMIFLTIALSLQQLISTPSLILLRKVNQRRRAVIELVVVLLSTPIMIWLAYRGVTLWVLLAGEFVTAGVSLVLYYCWRPVWKPFLSWDPQVIKYYLNFGRRNFLNSILDQAMDLLDDIWVGLFLGETATGLYSKAYSFATYPRKILAHPINWVIGGAYAELKGNRERLSYLFKLVNTLLIRSSFFLAGSLVLIAPEFISVFLGEKWLPMLTTFRLMLIFTLFDPIKTTLASVISLAGGEPQIVVKARLYQLTIMILGIFILGPLLGINGVAIAVDVMLFVGIFILLTKVRLFVDYSGKELFATPFLALLLGLSSGISLGLIVDLTSYSALMVLVSKGVLFSLVYLSILVLVEYRKLMDIIGYMWEFVRNR